MGLVPLMRHEQMDGRFRNTRKIRQSKEPQDGQGRSYLLQYAKRRKAARASRNRRHALDSGVSHVWIETTAFHLHAAVGTLQPDTKSPALAPARGSKFLQAAKVGTLPEGRMSARGFFEDFTEFLGCQPSLGVHQLIEQAHHVPVST